MKRIIPIVAMLVASQAHAGFITGMLVGNALANRSQSNPSAPVVIGASDPNHSVIICRKVYSTQLCTTPAGMQDVTPEAYAKMYGFTHVYSVGAAITNDNDYIVIEVSK